jgi:transcriptional regulator with XRE-family HTH domain
MASPTSRDLGRTIRALRHERRLTIEDLAFLADVHPTYLSAIERGEHNPSWEKLRSLAHALGLPVAEVVQCAESQARIQRGFERVLADERSRRLDGDGYRVL